MKTNGEFTFIELKHIDAGSFINDKGESVSYKGSYKLRVNEETEYGIKERVFKIPEDDSILISEIKNLNPYDKIEIYFEILIFAANIKLMPVSINVVY